jgi:dTDP-D-glucose 4,6-dehydratase
MAFHRFCKALVCHEPLSLYGDGYQTRDFTYIDDAIEATVRAATISEAAGQMINIASGTSATLRSIVELLEKISGLRINVVIDDSQRDELHHTCADIQRAQQLLGYRPRINLQDGLIHEFEFIRRLYEHWQYPVTRGANNSDGHMPSKDSTVAKKATTVKLTAVPRQRASQADNRMSDPIAKTAQ